MYPPSSSSSSSSSMTCSSAQNHKPLGPTNLTRYVSAPGSLLTSAVDSIIGSHQPQHQPSLVPPPHYFSSPHDSSSSCSSFTADSTCKVNSSNDPKHSKTGLQRSYGLNEIAHCSLLRQRSSPAGFLTSLTAENGTFYFLKVFSESRFEIY